MIEVDGGQHSEAQSYDAARTRHIQDEGYRVLRFWNNDVLANTDGVIARISLSLREREGAHAQHGKGEGEGDRAMKKGAPTFADAPSPFRPFGPPYLSQGERER